MRMCRNANLQIVLVFCDLNELSKSSGSSETFLKIVCYNMKNKNICIASFMHCILQCFQKQLRVHVLLGISNALEKVSINKRTGEKWVRGAMDEKKVEQCNQIRVRPRFCKRLGTLPTFFELDFSGECPRLRKQIFVRGCSDFECFCVVYGMTS